MLPYFDFFNPQQTQEQWQIVFYIAAVMYAVGAIFFNIFADGELQEWAKPYMYENMEAKQHHKPNKNGWDNMAADPEVATTPSLKAAEKDESTKL